MQHLGLAVSLPVVLAMALAAPPRTPIAKTTNDWNEILDAIRHVESGGRLHPPDGDGGDSIGPYQIQRSYWIDSRVPGDYQQCRQRDYAERVILAYMQRYVPEALAQLDAEVIARVHNGGPLGMRKTATLRYWHKVRQRLPARRQPD